MTRGASSPRQGAAHVLGALRALAGLGPSTAAAVVANTVRAEVASRHERRLGRRPAVARVPGRLGGFEPVTERRLSNGRRGRPVVVGVSCRFDEADLEVRFLADDVVRVSWGPDDPPIPWALTPACGGVLTAEDAAGDGRAVGAVSAPGTGGATGLGPAGRVKVVADGDGGCVVATRALAVTVGADGSVSYRGPSGGVVRRELPPLRRGTRRLHRHLLRPGERVAGLGEQSGGVALGPVHRLWNRDPGGGWGPGSDPLYCVIPVMVGTHRDGDVLVFFDNPYDAKVRIDAPAVGSGRVEVDFAGGMLRHFVCVGPLPSLHERYGALTGRPPLPPRWALGYHQSRWGYRSQADIRAVADGFARERLPLSAVHLDIDYMDGYRIFTVDPQRFPDLSGLTADLARRGTRAVAIVDPAVKVDPGYDVYRSARDEGRLVRRPDGSVETGVVWPGPAAFPDFTDPLTRRWWGTHYRRLLDAGVGGVWHDMNEPTSITLWGDRTLMPSARHVAEGLGAEHRQCHNVYGLLMDAAGWAALRAERPERRPFVLSRAGWAGVQRWAWTWTGDSDSTWPALRQQVATAVGLGLSGVAFCGPDIGGFSGAPSDELYLRWLELAVLMPLCRTHCVAGVPGREPWRFPEPFRSAIGHLVRFRYRFLPYLYTLAHEASVTGRPLVRPPWWPPATGRGAAPAPTPPTPPTSWADTAFLLGDGLLVAPVLEPGASGRLLGLPAGEWLRWRPGVLGGPGEIGPAVEGPGDLDVVEPVAAGGGMQVELDVPFGSAALLVRAGTVVPLDDGWAGRGEPGDDGAVTPGHGPRLLALHCFPDSRGQAIGRVFDDAGDGDGPARLDEVRLVAGPGRSRTLQWVRTGEWPPPERVRVVVHGLTAAAASADGSPVTVRVVGAGPTSATLVDCRPFDALELQVTSEIR